MNFRLAILFMVALTTAACSQPPFIDHPSTNGSMMPAKEIPGQIFVCYNPSSSTLADATALAQEACALTEQTAVFVDQTRYQCRLLVPMRAEFRCDPPRPTAKPGTKP
ncbi:MAG: hypothetical protein HQL37_15435 [Alphaproteobacteria bacterium]|nr:hypothetical protein [Alphaproteobacteria bacterium]